jgi:hypothetical protein
MVSDREVGLELQVGERGSGLDVALDQVEHGDVGIGG